MESTPQIVPENFLNDHAYTTGSLVEELALIERHLRDGSSARCRCVYEKHLPMVAGLASEGYGFAEDEDEREFMRRIRDYSRIMKEKIGNRPFEKVDADEIRNWAREARHRLEWRNWLGEMSEAPEIDEDANELQALNYLSLPEMEEQYVAEAVDYLARKYSVPAPSVEWSTDLCDPRRPNAQHIQVDAVTEDGKEPRPMKDRLIFCRGASSAYAVSHEFSHYLRHYRGEVDADEGEADIFAEAESRNNLTGESSTHPMYTGCIQPLKGSNKGKPYKESNIENYMVSPMDAIIKKSVPIFIGLAAAKVTDKYISPKLDTPLGAMATVGKTVIGAAALWFGLKKDQGVVSDVLAFGGAALILDQAAKFLPGGSFLSAGTPVYAAAPIASAAMPYSPPTIGAASPYSGMYQSPIQLSGGFPGVARVDGKFVEVRV